MESASKVHFFAEKTAIQEGSDNELKPEFKTNKIEALNKAGHAMHMIPGAFRDYALSKKIVSMC